MLKNWLSISFLILLSVFTTQNTFARKIYVSNAGNDSRTIVEAQNPATPWASLAKVQSSLSSITSGDSILLKKGDKFRGTFTVTSKTGVYFGSYGTGEKPLLWGTGVVLNNLIILRTCTNITIDGWYIDDTTISRTDRSIDAKIQRAITMETSSFSNIIKNCLIERAGLGVYVNGSSGSSLIDSTEIRNLRMIRDDSTRDNDYGATAVQLSGSNNTVTNNFFHGCWANSIDYRFDGGSIEFYVEAASDTIRNNLVAYNTFYDNNGTIEHGALGSSNRSFRNNKVYYNKILNCGSITYINVTGQYGASVKGLDISNNVYVQNVPRRNSSSGQWVMDMSTTVANQDTIIKFRNNVVQSSANMIMISTDFSASQFIHTNNLYKLSGGSTIGVTASLTELTTSGVIWVNTLSANPSLWDYNLTSTSPARGAGVNIGLTRDFNNQVVSTPFDIGILQYTGVTPTPCTFVYTDWTTCLNGTQSRTYTASPNGCSGTPIADSLFRSCSLPCTFVYSAWSICLDSFQTRTVTSSPTGCTTAPPSDSIRRRCNSTPDSCTMDYTFTTTRSSCVGKANGSITITSIPCSAGPYTLTLTRYLNPSTITRTTSATVYTFSNLFSGSYGLTIRDSRGTTVFKYASVSAKSNRRFCR